MTADQKQEFTRRISISNRTGLVVILLEMLLCYLEDASKAWEKEQAFTPPFEKPAAVPSAKAATVEADRIPPAKTAAAVEADQIPPAKTAAAGEADRIPPAKAAAAVEADRDPSADAAAERVREASSIAFKEAIRKAQQVLKRLEDDLDFKYEVSMQLMQLYVFSERTLAMALVRHVADGVETVQRIIRPLWEAFVEVEKQDDSPPLMANTQQVYAGMTYQKGALSESVDISQTGRGFLA